MSDLNEQEARLIAVLRAIGRFDDAELVPEEDASMLAFYLPAILPLDEVEQQLNDKELKCLLDGFIAGVGANRLMQAGLRPIDIATRAATVEEEFQTGIDPLTGEPRTQG